MKAKRPIALLLVRNSGRRHYFGFAGCAWIMSAFGFLPGAIAAVFLLMLTSGERRLALIVPVSLLLPVATWLTIVQLLSRSLP